MYGIPITEYSTMRFGASADRSEILGFSRTVLEINQFLAEHGRQYRQSSITLGYAFDTRDRTIFPESGTRQNFILQRALPSSDLEYYKFNYRADYYWPVFSESVFHFEYDIGVGDGFGDLNQLPFFEKYVAGGARSLRGFEARSIAPEGTQLLRTSRQSPLGGDLMTIGSLEYILPPLGEGASARGLVFYDFGSVYPEWDDFDASEFRSSYGIAINWLSPMGAMTISYAVPLEKQPQDTSDDIKRLQFSVGASF